VRTINVVVGAPTIQVTANGATTWPAVPYAAATPFTDLDNVSTTFVATLPGAASPLAQTTYTLSGESTYTLIVYGTTQEPSVAVLPDTPFEPGGGRSQLRLAQAAPGIGAVDLYLTTPGQTFDSTVAPSFASVAFGGATNYIQFGSGTYQVRITVAGTQAVLYDSGLHAFSDNTSTDVILYAVTSGRLPNALFADANGALQNQTVNNALAGVKFVAAAPQSGALNVVVDGTTLVSGLAYGQASTYASVAAAGHSISFEAAATPGAPIATATPTLAPATDTTIVATGLPGSTQAFTLNDDNVPPRAGQARARFVNAGIDVGPVDVRVDNVKLASAIAPNAASGYVQIAAGTHEIAFVDSANGAPLATLSGVALNDGTTTTAVFAGTRDAPTAFTTQDD
jgi:hypothetical protein